MKIQAFLKIAVVATAALAAYAFSGSNANDLYIHEDGKCRNITAPCGPSGNELCKLVISTDPNSDPEQVWLSFGCVNPAYYSEM